MEFEAAQDSFMEYVHEHFPEAVVGQDEDGQFVIFTNLRQDSDGRIIPFEDNCNAS